jgi:DNA-directed RNA polymerase specialized sigma24 family protein
MVTSGGRGARFETTEWSVVLAAGGEQSSAVRAALATLCETYWYPLYAYVRRQGHTADDARDLTQAFFARFLEKQAVLHVRRERERFRSFLLACIRNFLLNEAEHRRTLKHGGGQVVLSLDSRPPKVDTSGNRRMLGRRSAFSIAVGRSPSWTASCAACVANGWTPAKASSSIG